MTQKKTYRLAQVNRLLREEIAALLLTETQDPRLRDMTVTEVRSAKDLKHALVFATTGTHDPEEAIQAARKSAGYLRKLLYTRLRLKHIPELEFRYDESLDRANRIFTTLQNMDLSDEHDNENDEK